MRGALGHAASYIPAIVAHVVSFTGGIKTPWIRPVADGTTAIQLQNTSGTAILNVDTTNKAVSIGATGLQSTALLGSELTTNGGFTTDLTGWTGTNWAWEAGADGQARHTAGATTALAQNITAASGTTYHIVLTMTGRTAGSVTVAVGAVSLNAAGATAHTASVTATLVAGATGSVALSITPTTDFDGAITAISVKAITAASTAALVLKDDAGSNAIEMRGDASQKNVGIGPNALGRVTTGTDNIGIGTSLAALTTGGLNIAIGTDAGRALTTGQRNVAMGVDALYSNATGSYNMAIGYQALYAATGNFGCAVGYAALSGVTSGTGNTGIGSFALSGVTDGPGNIGIGYQAGDNITTGDYNIVIGYNKDAPSATANYQLIVGDYIVGDGSTLGLRPRADGTTAVQLQNAAGVAVLAVDTTNTRVGIGATPTAKLHVDQSSTTAAVPVLLLDQADLDQNFICFVGESTTDNSQCLVDAANLTTPGSIAGYVKVYIQDDAASGAITDGVYYMPFYTTPTA